MIPAEILAIRSPSWMRRALCATGGHDPEMWFPEPQDSPLKAARALWVCRRCPVRGQCLRHAMETEESGSSWGIRGGMTARERARKRNKLRKRNDRSPG
jgi:WhiB family redox-sensing transcriptional regulator